MKTVITVIAAVTVVSVGYITYHTIQQKRQQEIKQVIQEAQSSLEQAQHNPHHLERSTFPAFDTAGKSVQTEKVKRFLYVIGVNGKENKKLASLFKIKRLIFNILKSVSVPN